MGNCLRHESSDIWCGEDWGSPLPQKLATKNGMYNKSRRNNSTAEEESLLGDDHKRNVPCTTEVKIKITKKELEELLGKVDVQGLSVEQVLSHLINASDEYHTHQKSWRPALQSIPEVN
ncbi:hypothetical protein IFM89_018262 [Coptis chinensis]|uniref:Uncharacterized protein n=1 Tax=Coptis chinensis TaxID=261450 RepID=A0A835GZY4_9MAGN|nr:hypothetical protein IFM89_018262 [Coptis chinensis]